MALVNGGFLHYTDIKKFLRYLHLRNQLSDFEIISQKCSLSDLSQKTSAKFWFIEHGSSKWDFHHMDMNKFLKNLLL